MTDRHAVLLRLAREAIDTSFRGADVELPTDPWLHVPTAVFVTLKERRNDELRGCIGSIEPHLPLGAAVVSAARSAAFKDGRFQPLVREELGTIRLEISVLSPTVRLPVDDEADARRRLGESRPGVILRSGPHHGVFLPKVWEAIPDAGEFLRHLKLKAGLSPTFWTAAIELHVFTSDDCAEGDDRTGRTEAS